MSSSEATVEIVPYDPSCLKLAESFGLIGSCQNWTCLNVQARRKPRPSEKAPNTILEHRGNRRAARLSMMDVPSPIDLRSVVDAREWANTAMVRRPWRTEFFASIAQELALVNAPSILELVSGPGFLAQHLLSALAISAYVALDFSSAMHDLAKERLGPLTERVTFVERDFRVEGWSDGLPSVDAVVTIQAVHERRHKRHAPTFYRAIRALVEPSGLLLVCDHVAVEGGMTNSELFMTPNEQETAILEGGFSTVELLMLKGGLALFRAGNSN